MVYKHLYKHNQFKSKEMNAPDIYLPILRESVDKHSYYNLNIDLELRINDSSQFPYLGVVISWDQFLYTSYRKILSLRDQAFKCPYRVEILAVGFSDVY